MSATFTSALRAMVAPGNHLGSPLGKATPKEPKPIRLLVKRKRIIAGGFGNYIGDGQGPTRNANHDQAMYTSFLNAAAAGLNADGTLTAKSPNRRAGTDRKDTAADFDELLRAYTGQSSRK